MSIHGDIVAEQVEASEKWGIDFDDKNTINDWVTYICMYAGQAGHINASPDEQRRQLVKVAGLAISAISTFDRNNGFPPRHYG